MIKIRKAGPADNEDILLWRNDLATREASFSLEMISPEAHRAWFEKALKSTDRSLYLAENESGEKIGVVRIDELNPAAAEININLAPAMRGKGYGAKIIQLACSDSKYKLVIARTKEKNIASVRVFLRAGFTHLFDYVDKRWGGVVVLGKIASGKDFSHGTEIPSDRRETFGIDKELEKF